MVFSCAVDSSNMIQMSIYVCQGSRTNSNIKSLSRFSKLIWYARTSLRFSTCGFPILWSRHKNSFPSSTSVGSLYTYWNINMFPGTHGPDMFWYNLRWPHTVNALTYIYSALILAVWIAHDFLMFKKTLFQTKSKFFYWMSSLIAILTIICPQLWHNWCRSDRKCVIHTFMHKKVHNWTWEIIAIQFVIIW